MKKILFTVGLLTSTLCVPAISQARDTVLNLPFQAVVQQMIQEKKLDDNVKFYLADTGPQGEVISRGIVTNKKTNAFNKTDEEACNWVLESALLSLQDSAKKAGANAVTNIISFYKRQDHSDRTTYECHAGAIMAGVTLKGDLVKVK